MSGPPPVVPAVRGSAPIGRSGDDDDVSDTQRASSPQRRGSPQPLPPDPVAYDSERNAAARRRGLPTPYIPGGTDPEEERTAANERRLTRLLIAMIVLIVLSGFVIGTIALLLGFDALAGRSG